MADDDPIQEALALAARQARSTTAANLAAVESMVAGVTEIAEGLASSVDTARIANDGVETVPVDRPRQRLGDLARASMPSAAEPSCSWIRPVRVASTAPLRTEAMGNGPLMLSTVDGIALDDLDRVLLTSRSEVDEPGVYEYQARLGFGHGELVRILGDFRGSPPLAVYVEEGSIYENCVFVFNDTEGNHQWLQVDHGPVSISLCLTAGADLRDVQRAAENWTPEAVARFLAVLHARRSHKDEDPEKDGETFSVKLDEAIQDDEWEADADG